LTYTDPAIFIAILDSLVSFCHVQIPGNRKALHQLFTTTIMMMMMSWYCDEPMLKDVGGSCALRPGYDYAAITRHPAP